MYHSFSTILRDCATSLSIREEKNDGSSRVQLVNSTEPHVIKPLLVCMCNVLEELCCILMIIPNTNPEVAMRPVMFIFSRNPLGSQDFPSECPFEYDQKYTNIRTTAEHISRKSMSQFQGPFWMSANQCTVTFWLPMLVELSSNRTPAENQPVAAQTCISHTQE